MARRKYSREFKRSAVQLVNHQGYSVVEAAKSLGVDPNCIRGWIAKFGGEPQTAPAGEGAVQAELRRQGVAIWAGALAVGIVLLMERDILKKAAAFFAKEQS